MTEGAIYGFYSSSDEAARAIAEAEGMPGNERTGVRNTAPMGCVRHEPPQTYATRDGRWFTEKLTSHADRRFHRTYAAWALYHHPDGTGLRPQPRGR